jgi:Flp pilus assembly protein TadG
MRSLHRRESRGQTLIEFAVLLPVLLMMIMGGLDLGRIVWANDLIGNAAREGARYAIVHGASKTTLCPVGPPSVDTVIPAASPACPYPSPSKEGIRQAARNWAIAAGHTVTVQVCYGIGCTGDTNTAAATTSGAVRGTPVTVTVNSRVDMAAAALIGIAGADVSASATMLVNH